MILSFFWPFFWIPFWIEADGIPELEKIHEVACLEMKQKKKKNNIDIFKK